MLLTTYDYLQFTAWLLDYLVVVYFLLTIIFLIIQKWLWKIFSFGYRFLIFLNSLLLQQPKQFFWTTQHNKKIVQHNNNNN